MEETWGLCPPARPLTLRVGKAAPRDGCQGGAAQRWTPRGSGDFWEAPSPVLPARLPAGGVPMGGTAAAPCAHHHDAASLVLDGANEPWDDHNSVDEGGPDGCPLGARMVNTCRSGAVTQEQRGHLRGSSPPREPRARLSCLSFSIEHLLWSGGFQQKSPNESGPDSTAWGAPSALGKRPPSILSFLIWRVGALLSRACRPPGSQGLSAGRGR